MSNYNDKLFSGGTRGRLHQMRFRWLQKHVREPKDGYTLFELGCFDCRSLGYIPKPKQYMGVDAGWEGGIEDARMNYLNRTWMELIMAQSAHDLVPHEGRRFDYSIALETLEHIPDAVLKGYIEFLAKVTKKKLLITVPVEVGPVFLAKYLAKTSCADLASGETESYTTAEVFWATMGRADRVQRYEHKGFDYRKLITQLAQHFTIVKVEGIPFKHFPYLSFQVGIVAQPKGMP